MHRHILFPPHLLFSSDCVVCACVCVGSVTNCFQLLACLLVNSGSRLLSSASSDLLDVQIFDHYRRNLRSKAWTCTASRMFKGSGFDYGWFCLARALVFNQPPTPNSERHDQNLCFRSVRPSHWVSSHLSSGQPSDLQICPLKTVKLHPPRSNLSKRTAGHFTYVGHTGLHFRDSITRLCCSLDPLNRNNDLKKWYKMPFGVKFCQKTLCNVLHGPC